MHDPKVLVFDLPWIKLDVWHNEPQGRDHGTVCKGMAGTALSWHNVRWAFAHRRHLNYRFWPYLGLKRWIVDRCSECGRRFLWKDGRFGYWDGTTVYHDQCMSLRHLRSQLDDAAAVMRGKADWNQNWRVERWLEHVASVEDLGDSGVAQAGGVSDGAQ